MDLNRYTNKAQEALFKAQSLANEYGHSDIDPLHILIGLMSQKDGVVPEIAAKIGARPQALLAELEQTLNDRPRTYGSNAQSRAEPRRDRRADQRRKRSVATCTTITSAPSTFCWR